MNKNVHIMFRGSLFKFSTQKFYVRTTDVTGSVKSYVFPSLYYKKYLITSIN
jgi:hypothetical protein